VFSVSLNIDSLRTSARRLARLLRFSSAVIKLWIQNEFAPFFSSTSLIKTTRQIVEMATSLGDINVKLIALQTLAKLWINQDLLSISVFSTLSNSALELFNLNKHPWREEFIKNLPRWRHASDPNTLFVKEKSLVYELVSQKKFLELSFLVLCLVQTESESSTQKELLDYAYEFLSQAENDTARAKINKHFILFAVNNNFFNEALKFALLVPHSSEEFLSTIIMILEKLSQNADRQEILFYMSCLRASISDSFGEKFGDYKIWPYVAAMFREPSQNDRAFFVSLQASLFITNYKLRYGCLKALLDVQIEKKNFSTAYQTLQELANLISWFNQGEVRAYLLELKNKFLESSEHQDQPEFKELIEFLNDLIKEIPDD